jgi:parallel beta-helix repeat protein
MSNGQNGIGIYYSTGSEISHNICSDNAVDGLAIMWSSGCAVSWNLASENVGYGAGLYYSSGCTVWNNTFMFNHGSTTEWDPGAVQGYDDGSNDWNTDGTPHGWGNFWSDWATPDDDSNGIVDYSYEIDGPALAEDFYPLAEPRYGFAKLVFGIVRGDDGNPLEGAGVTVVMKDGETVVSMKAALTDSSGAYNVTFEWLLWNVGYTIEVTATYESVQASNSTDADVNAAQEVDVTYEYEIPDFGSLWGFLIAGLLVGAVGIILLMRQKGKGA